MSKTCKTCKECDARLASGATTCDACGATQPARIAVTCACGAAFKAKARQAGKRVRCPKCEAPVRVPKGTTTKDAKPERQSTSSTPRRADRASKGDAEPAAKTEGRRNLDHEAHVRGLAAWCGLGALAQQVLVVVFFAFAFKADQAGMVGNARDLRDYGAKLFLLSLLSGVSLVGLWTYRGWGRWTALAAAGGVLALDVHSMVIERSAELSLLHLGADAVWVGAVLWVVNSEGGAQVLSAAYRKLVAEEPEGRVRWWASPVFYLPWAIVGALVALSIAWAIFLEL